MSDHRNISRYAEYLSLGAEIAVGIVAPIFIGYGLDIYFDTSPWLLLAGCGLGMLNIFFIVFHLNKRLNKK